MWHYRTAQEASFEVLPSVVDTDMTAGRGRAKIPADKLAEEFWRDFHRDRFEMRIGLVKLFALLHRVAPSFVENRVRYG